MVSVGMLSAVILTVVHSVVKLNDVIVSVVMVMVCLHVSPISH
jgi:hypothetical protein